MIIRTLGRPAPGLADTAFNTHRNIVVAPAIDALRILRRVIIRLSRWSTPTNPACLGIYVPGGGYILLVALAMRRQLDHIENSGIAPADIHI
ncbi:MAG: hypothetical protein PVJ86_02450 [Phycisphaerales bacterium]